MAQGPVQRFVDEIDLMIRARYPDLQVLALWVDENWQAQEVELPRPPLTE